MAKGDPTHCFIPSLVQTLDDSSIKAFFDEIKTISIGGF